MYRKDLIDTDMLDELITQHKGMYLQSYVNTLKIPSLNARCEEELATTTDDKKKEALTSQIAQNNANLVSNKEQMKNLEEMTDKLLSFKSSL
jgi:hypothetical protein